MFRPKKIIAYESYYGWLEAIIHKGIPVDKCITSDDVLVVIGIEKGHYVMFCRCNRKRRIDDEAGERHSVKQCVHKDGSISWVDDSYCKNYEKSFFITEWKE